LSEEKTSIEKDLKSKLNISNSTVYELTKQLENLQKEIEEKSLNNNKLFEDCQNLTHLIQTKTNNIKELKSSIKQLEQKNIELENQIDLNIKEIEYLKSKNIFNLIDSENNENKNNEKVEYYEKQLNDSNKTIQKMGEMIHDLEKQIEELQKELENNNYIENKNNEYSSDIKELVDLINKKDKEIKQYQIEIRVLNEEKSKLYEDNTQMYTNLDCFQKYIIKLENKRLSKQINNFTDNQTLNLSEVNEDDISNNNLEFLSKTNDIEKQHNIKDNICNLKYNGLSDSEINENVRVIKINKNKYKKYLNGNKKQNNENEKQNDNKVELYFNYENKPNGELSD